MTAKRHNLRWTPELCEQLGRMATTMGDWEIADQLGISAGAVRRRRWDLQIPTTAHRRKPSIGCRMGRPRKPKPITTIDLPLEVAKRARMERMVQLVERIAYLRRIEYQRNWRTA
jgi:hypothetical protein